MGPFLKGMMHRVVRELQIRAERLRKQVVAEARYSKYSASRGYVRILTLV